MNTKLPKTQIELAAEVGISQSYLSELLSRKKRASPDVAEKLEEATGWNAKYWMFINRYDRDGNLIAHPLPTPPADQSPQEEPQP